MKVSQFKIIEGFEGFWLSINRISEVKIGTEIKTVVSMCNVHNHDKEEFFESYISPKDNNIDESLAKVLNFHLSHISVNDILAKVNLRCNSINGTALFADVLNTEDILDFQVISDKFVLNYMWLEHVGEFVYNDQIRVKTPVDYRFYEDGTSTTTVDTDRIISISLMKTKNVDGVEVEDIIEDEYFQTEECGRIYAKSTERIGRFLDGYFFGRKFDDNLFFGKEQIDYDAIKKEFFDKLGISYIN